MALFIVVSHLQVQNWGSLQNWPGPTLPRSSSPNVAQGTSYEYIWPPHNQNGALAAVNEARQVAERRAKGD